MAGGQGLEARGSDRTWMRDCGGGARVLVWTSPQPLQSGEGICCSS